MKRIVGASVVLALLGLGLAQEATAVAAEDTVFATLADYQTSLDTFALLMFAVLVAFMQPGFALLEAGLHNSKNVVNIFMKNIADFSVAGLAYWAFGFAIMYGAPFFLGGYGSTVADVEGGLFYTGAADFFFQMVFAATAATIVSGAIGGRMKFSAYLIFCVVMTGLIYPYLGSWHWGGGWLGGLNGGEGFYDFAGSSVVHAVGGFAALGAVLAIGPRLGRYAGGKVNAMPGHNMSLAGLGVFLLWIGWFGFNPGSQLVFNDVENITAVANIFVNTNLAAAAGAVAAMFTSWALFKKPDFSMTINGILAGLVGITAGPDVIVGGSAVVVGAIAGIIVVFSVLMFDRLKVDDPVGAISVHGICGIWGTLAVAIFGAGAAGFLAQLIGTLAYSAAALVSGYVIFMILKFTVGLRVTADEEVTGLDIAEHGIEGYPSDDSIGNPVVMRSVGAGD